MAFLHICEGGEEVNLDIVKWSIAIGVLSFVGGFAVGFLLASGIWGLRL